MALEKVGEVRSLSAVALLEEYEAAVISMAKSLNGQLTPREEHLCNIRRGLRREIIRRLKIAHSVATK